MNAAPPRTLSSFRRELIVVLALLILGAGLRAWNPAHLGLQHFDEGIYALAGLWSLAPHGLADLDLGLIPYAPPGFPILVGCSYWLFGPGDLAAIAVSILMGTLTIGLVWLAGRNLLGPLAGVLAAALAACSGPHVAFSRMALVDVSFTALWILAIWAGIAFLQRPNAPRAILFGLAVGLAQLFKYSGWVAGAIVVVLALGELAFDHGCPRGAQRKIWSWGLLAALVAAAVYAPWFLFVERHGGYAALLAHQQGYMGPIRAWPAHLIAQHYQERALSGGWRQALLASLALAAACGALRPRLEALDPEYPWWVRFLTLVVTSVVATEFETLMVLFGVLTLLSLVGGRGILRLDRPHGALGAGYCMLITLTSFYHPYARLWLPVQALGWLLIGWGLASVLEPWKWRPWPEQEPASRRPLLRGACLLALLALLMAVTHWSYGSRPFLESSDSLRTAAVEIASSLPRDGSRVAFLGRPSAIFYLGQEGVNLDRKADLSSFDQGSSRGGWGIIDSVLLRQEGRKGPPRQLGDRGWRVERVIASRLSLTVLLDVEPAAATVEKPDRQAPFYLLRHVPDGIH